MLNTTQSAQTVFVPVRSIDKALLHKQSDDLKKRISTRAYEIFEHRGKVTGHDVDDWLKAEAEVLWETQLNSSHELSRFSRDSYQECSVR